MWVVFSAKGILNLLIAWFFLALTDFVVVTNVFKPLFEVPRHARFPEIPLSDVGLALFTAYQLLIMLAWLSHLRAATTDPGAVPKTAKGRQATGNGRSRLCRCCDGSWMPPRAHHCLTCGRCIFRMDHHCPWINNCIGAANQKLFVLFLAYTALTAVVTVLLLLSAASVALWRYFHVGVQTVPERGNADLPANVNFAQRLASPSPVLGSFAVLVCLGVAKWVGDYLLEQVQSIETNSTVVETYIGASGRPLPFWDQFRDVFGDSWWWWPLPVRASLPRLDYGEQLHFERGRVQRLQPALREQLNIAESEDEDITPTLERRPKVLQNQWRQTYTSEVSSDIQRNGYSAQYRRDRDDISQLQPLRNLHKMNDEFDPYSRSNGSARTRHSTPPPPLNSAHSMSRHTGREYSTYN